MAWIDNLKKRWNAGSTLQVILILCTFALTGTTVVWISKPLLKAAFDPDPIPTWGRIMYYIVILPVYNLFLLAFGFLLGQFKFFWEFEKRFFARMTRTVDKSVK